MNFSANICKTFAAALLCVFCASGIYAQGIREEPGLNSAGAPQQDLPVTRIAIFSSGLAYYEHTGTLSGPSVINLPFKANAVNDALKSLVLNDPASKNPSVSYQSEQTLLQTLRSLKIDLSNEPDMASIMRRLRGAEVQISVPSAISGRIVGVEYRIRNSPTGHESIEPWLSLNTEQGIMMFNFSEISAISFKDPQITSDLNRALDILASSRNYDMRDLSVNLPGNGSRKISLSYVIASPVWKVSYRLDLGAGEKDKPLFQGWAIVDNDSDSDWKNVELSLVAGRPASFIQNLYPPYYNSRPVVPLAIAGNAGAATHDAGYSALNYAKEMPAAAPAPAMRQSMVMAESMADYAYAPTASVAGGAIETASASTAGDQFEFTVKNPVNLDRRMSAMLPLVESNIEARKLIIYSGSNASGRNHNPRLGAELTNTSKIKLPAGSITVYDGGTYAGDALIEFWNEGEKRLISFGDDLSVTGSTADSSTRIMVSVTVAGGTMTFNRSQEYLKTYLFKNNSAQQKNLLIEHPKNSGAVLVSPNADEQTPSLYRFNMTLPAGKELTVAIKEARAIAENISLLPLRPETLLSYSTNQEIPAKVREALQKAVNLRNNVNSAEAAVNEANTRRSGFVTEQDRIRKNLEAVGSQTSQGQEYTKRLISLDSEIDAVSAQLVKLRADESKARKDYEDYLKNLNL